MQRCLWQKEADQLIIFVNGQEQDIQVQGGTGKIFSHIIKIIIDTVNIFIDVVCDTESRFSTARLYIGFPSLLQFYLKVQMLQVVQEPCETKSSCNFFFTCETFFPEPSRNQESVVRFESEGALPWRLLLRAGRGVLPVAGLHPEDEGGVPRVQVRGEARLPAALKAGHAGQVRTCCSCSCCLLSQWWLWLMLLLL